MSSQKGDSLLSHTTLKLKWVLKIKVWMKKVEWFYNTRQLELDIWFKNEKLLWLGSWYFNCHNKINTSIVLKQTLLFQWQCWKWQTADLNRGYLNQDKIFLSFI